MLRNIALNHKYFQSFLELGISELEDFDCLFHVLYRFQSWPLNFYLFKYNCFLIKFRKINPRVMFVAECEEFEIVVANSYLKSRSKFLSLHLIFRQQCHSSVKQILCLGKHVLRAEIICQVDTIQHKVFHSMSVS